MVTSTNGGTGNTANTTVTVVAPPSISKSFSPNSIAPTGLHTDVYDHQLQCKYRADRVTFTDTFPTSPAAVTVATPLTTTNTCLGTLTDNARGTLNAGDLGIGLTGGTVSAGGTCAVSVNITAPSIGSYVNTSGNVSSMNGGTGTTTSNSLYVFPDVPKISSQYVRAFDWCGRRQ